MRSTLRQSRPNKTGLKCLSVHKMFLQFKWNLVCVGGRWVMHDGMQYEPIQGQGHEAFKVGNPAIFKSYLLRHLQIFYIYPGFCVTWLLNVAEMSVAKSRPSVPYGANFWYMRVDRQTDIPTDGQTGMLITILSTTNWDEVTVIFLLEDLTRSNVTALKVSETNNYTECMCKYQTRTSNAHCYVSNYL